MNYLLLNNDQDEEPGSYTDLKMVVMGLRADELRLARQQLKKEKPQTTSNTLRLLEYVLQHPQNEKEKARIYLRETKNAFNKTVQRLLKKLDYILVSEENIVNSNYFSSKFRAHFEISTALIAADIYRTRGMQHRAHKVVDAAIQKARTYEEYCPLIELLQLKHAWLMLSGEKKEALAYRKESQHFIECQKILLDAKNLFHEIGEKIKLAGPRIDHTTELKVKTLHRYADITGSLQIKFYVLTLEFNLASGNNDPVKAEAIANAFYKLVNENELLNKKLNIGIAYLYMAAAYLQLRKFDLCLQFSKIAKEYFSDNTYNFFHTDELEFYALFFLNRFDEAEEKLLTIINNEFYTKSNFLENKKEYLLACIYFVKGQYHETVRLLNMIHEIPKDKTGWNFGIKNLTLMLTILKGDFDSAVRLTESYERDLKRIRQKQKIRKRDTVIFKLFKRYAMQGSISKAIDSMKEEFGQLFSSDTEYVQIIPGHEMISVNEWFLCIKDDTQYVFSGPNNVSRIS